MIFFEEEKKRTPISKTVWETIKASHNYRCIICGGTEKSVGGLEKAHIKAHSKGGSPHVLPMCPNCHHKYDNELLTATQLKKLGLTKEGYARLRPKKPKKKKDSFFF